MSPSSSTSPGRLATTSATASSSVRSQKAMSPTATSAAGDEAADDSVVVDDDERRSPPSSQDASTTSTREASSRRTPSLQQNGGVRTERIEHWTFAALLLAFAVLVVSGLFLTFHYRPTYGEDHGATIAHRVAAFAAIGLAAVLAGCGIVRRRLWSIGVVLVLVAAVVTGDDLPWSQLALWAVTVGGDFSGVLRAAFDDQI